MKPELHQKYVGYENEIRRHLRARYSKNNDTYNLVDVRKESLFFLLVYHFLIINDIRKKTNQDVNLLPENERKIMFEGLVYSLGNIFNETIIDKKEINIIFANYFDYLKYDFIIEMINEHYCDLYNDYSRKVLNFEKTIQETLETENGFDKFKAFTKLDHLEFGFKVTNYETWKSGELVDKGVADSLIIAKIINENDTNKTKIEIVNNTLENQISTYNIFDIVITSNDRIQLLIIPEVTNSENLAIMLFKLNVGVTRQLKNFNEEEPYCCNLFLHNGKIVKMSFSFSYTEKLIEFYNQDLIVNLNKINEEIISKEDNDFEKLKIELLKLPKNTAYKCNIFDSEDDYLTNTINCNIEINNFEIIFNINNGKFDKVIFYMRNKKLFFKYVKLNEIGTSSNETFQKIELRNPNNNELVLEFDCSKWNLH